VQQLRAIAAAPTTALLVARDEATAIHGMLTLAWYTTPTGTHFWIEDVVVDAAVRGHGIGEALCRAALTLAKTNGATSLNLTSRPSREAANRLYLRLGFALRETNVYRFTF
jgi:ribosomal protein S18 acetylase RimI-like enzyme